MSVVFDESPRISTLYLQLEYGVGPHAILGIRTAASEAEIRDAYRAIALRIHPDKVRSKKLQELHTSLFQKVQDAYQQLAGHNTDHASEEPTTTVAHQKRPETFASLHARNLEFKEALKKERSSALERKVVEDEIKARRKAKNERLAAKREARIQEAGCERLKRDEQVLKWDKEREARSQAPAVHAPVADADVEDWEQEENRLQKKAKARAKRPVQDKPTERLPLELDPNGEYRVPEEDIQHRWDLQLRGGGVFGSLSLMQREQRESTLAAQMQKRQIALCDEADALRHHIYLPVSDARNNKTTLDSEKLLAQIEALEREAFVGMEAWFDRARENALQLMDQDVVEQHCLGDSELPRTKALESLMITAE